MADEPFWIRQMRKLKGGARVIAKYQRPADPNAGVRLPDFVHVTGHEHFRLDLPMTRAYVKCVGPVGEHVWGLLGEMCARCGMTREAYMQTSPFPTPALLRGYPIEPLSDAKPPSDRCVPVSWWYCDPLGHWGRWPADRVVEHEDGAVTVYEGGVFQNVGPYEPWWRGSVVRGVWAGGAVRVEASLDVK